MKKRLIAGLLMWMMIAPTACAEGVGQVDMGYLMLKPLYDAQGSYVCSPLSLHQALSMAARGAAGETKAQLDALLGSVDVKDLEDFDQLQSANAAVVAPDVALTDDYAAALAEDYGALVMPLDEHVVDELNGWASEQTGGMIPQVLTAQPDPDVKLMLVNALLLDAEWQSKFHNSYKDAFHGAAGDAEADFMSGDGMTLAYAESDGLQAVRLPYVGDQIEMIVVLPKAGGMADLLQKLGEQGPAALGTFSEPRKVDLTMPKFSLSSDLNMKELAQGLGVTDAFTGAADFSGMTGGTELYISAILQKARIDVDEDGTKAGAATAVIASAKGLSLDVVKMTVDRPFLALVRARGSGELLFAAVVEDL